MSALPATSDDKIIWDTWLSQYRLAVLTVADEAGTFSAISSRSLTTAELAAELKVDPRALQIHLGLLATLGFVERREGRWRATAAARTWMHPQAEGYYGPMLSIFREREPLHAQMLATLRTGNRPAGHVSSVDEWERGAMTPEFAKFITAFMNAHSQAAARGVAAQPLFSEVRSLLDVGGGSGIFPIQMAKAWPRLRATVMEITQVCAEADQYIATAGAQAQVNTQAVNMFTEEWPRGHDAHFFSNIFHDWSDATCLMLARKSFEALPAGGCILLHEMLMDDDGCGPLAPAAFSMMMLLGTKGRQYTLPELRGFLEAAGFADIEAWRTGGGYYSLVMARKP
jgi:3-hydroxy-5-methyl-1-naphthoate 3-O-methyltransferase